MIVSGEDKIISGERNIKLDEKGFLNQRAPELGLAGTISS